MRDEDFLCLPLAVVVPDAPPPPPPPPPSLPPPYTQHLTHSRHPTHTQSAHSHSHSHRTTYLATLHRLIHPTTRRRPRKPQSQPTLPKKQPPPTKTATQVLRAKKCHVQARLIVLANRKALLLRALAHISRKMSQVQRLRSQTAESPHLNTPDLVAFKQLFLSQLSNAPDTSSYLSPLPKTFSRVILDDPSSPKPTAVHSYTTPITSPNVSPCPDLDSALHLRPLPCTLLESSHPDPDPTTLDDLMMMQPLTPNSWSNDSSTPPHLPPPSYPSCSYSYTPPPTNDNDPNYDDILALFDTTTNTNDDDLPLDMTQFLDSIQENEDSDSRGSGGGSSNALEDSELVMHRFLSTLEWELGLLENNQTDNTRGRDGDEIRSHPNPNPNPNSNPDGDEDEDGGESEDEDLGLFL